jgi:hypothetical protein
MSLECSIGRIDYQEIGPMPSVQKCRLSCTQARIAATGPWFDHDVEVPARKLGRGLARELQPPLRTRRAASDAAISTALTRSVRLYDQTPNCWA